MILVTGGTGSLGSPTVRALAELGVGCVAVQDADLVDRARLLALGDRHEVTGVVHLAASPESALPDVLEAARTWGVARVTVAGGAGGGGPGTVRSNGNGSSAAVEVVHARIATTWGPGGAAHEPPFDAVVDVLAGRRPAAPAPLRAGERRDLCYVRDAAHALALLQTTPDLRRHTYEVGSGRATSNAEVAEVVAAMLPAVPIDLVPSDDPDNDHRGEPGRGPHLDPAALHRDTGYLPVHGLAGGLADWIATSVADARGRRGGAAR
jgi:UDP-glucose 4-epimerase